MGAIGLRASRRFARFCSSKTSTFTSRPHASQAVGSLRPKKQKAREGGPFFGGDWTRTNADRSRGSYSRIQYRIRRHAGEDNSKTIKCLEFFDLPRTIARHRLILIPSVPNLCREISDLLRTKVSPLLFEGKRDRKIFS